MKCFSMFVFAAGTALLATAAVTPNEMPGESDSARIEAAIASAAKSGGEVVIPRKNARTGKEIWLLDRAILMPSNMRLVLDDCLVRLAPGVQDNIIRNAGTALVPMQGNTNLFIVGKGRATLSGGTECHFNPPGDKGGWRTIGILLYNTRHFELKGFTVEEPQSWGISMENGCAYGRVGDIVFNNSNRNPNQDGVDVRKGCHDLVIENISGMTGDDSVALTGLRSAIGHAGKKGSGQIGDDYPAESDDIYNITIRNIRTFVSGGHSTIRLLNHDGIKLHDVSVSDVYDTSTPAQKRARNGVFIGDPGYSSLSRNQMGDTYNIFVTNINSRARNAVYIGATLKDAVLCGIHALDGSTPFNVANGKTQNVSIVSSPQITRQ